MRNKPPTRDTPVARLRLPPGGWVALGGGVGATARYLLGGWVTTWAQPGFPWGTFAVNACGSLLLGLLYRAMPAPTVSFERRGFLLIGLCGGFTTFSTFGYETLSLLRQARYATAGLYSLGSVITCIIGVYAGFRMAAVSKLRRRAEA